MPGLSADKLKRIRQAGMSVALILAVLSMHHHSCARAAEGGDGQHWRGVFEPREQAVIPAETTMKVMSMPKAPGDVCVKDELLVEFDDTIPKAAVASVKAKLNAVELNAKGMRSLFEKNQATAVEVARAESELAQVRLELVTAEREERSSKVFAPFGGKIVERKVREHEWANRGAPLLLLVDDAVLRVRFFLPEDKFSQVKLGDRVEVWTPAASETASGTITRLGVVFDPVSRTFDVWADVNNENDALRAGMTAEVKWPVAGGEQP